MVVSNFMSYAVFRANHLLLDEKWVDKKIES